MPQDERRHSPMYSQFDVSHESQVAPSAGGGSCSETTEQTRLLRELLSAQDRQNELIEELVHQLGAAQRQRAAELGQWRKAHPELARQCRRAAESLSRVQTEFLASLTEEITENAEMLMDGEFMLNEFVDRFGPRLAHLNGVLQVLGQLSANPYAPNAPNAP